MQRERNYGIDLLRIVCMLMIVSLHVAGHGGIFAAAEEGSPAWLWAWLPEMFEVCAVDCYALISGYVGVHGHWRPASLIALWLQVAFYSVGITALFGVLYPGTVGLADLARAAMPVTFQYVDYWYFTAYFGMFFLIPLLNHIVRTVPRGTLRKMLAALLLVFSVIPTLTRHDRFYLNDGYSVWWLAVLYLLGAYLGQYGDALKKIRGRRAAALYVGCSLLTYVLYVGSRLLGTHSALYAKISERFFGGQAQWFSYLAPTTLLAAVALLLLFVDVRVSPRLQKVVKWASPLSFGVYLIHNHTVLSDMWMEGSFAALAALPGPVMILAIWGAALCIYVVCTLLDALRAQLFRLLRIDRLACALESALGRAFRALLAAAQKLLG